MHSLYPSLGVRKWSKDHFEVMPVPEQNSQPKHKNTQNTQTKNRTKQPQNARKEHGMTAPISYGIQCQRIKRSCTSNKEWDASEHYICRKASRSREVPEEAILQMVRGLNTSHEPSRQSLCTVSGQTTTRASPPQNAALTRRALEEWERTLCENKAVSILEKLQEGRPALFQKDGGAMPIAIVLD